MYYCRLLLAMLASVLLLLGISMQVSLSPYCALYAAQFALMRVSAVSDCERIVRALRGGCFCDLVLEAIFGVTMWVSVHRVLWVGR